MPKIRIIGKRAFFWSQSMRVATWMRAEDPNGPVSSSHDLPILGFDVRHNTNTNDINTVAAPETVLAHKPDRMTEGNKIMQHSDLSPTEPQLLY